MISRVLIAFISFGFFVGCAHGFNRGELQLQLGVPKPVYDDKLIKAEFQKKNNLPKPFKLAIYFKKTGQPWRWTEEDKSLFDSLAKELRETKLVSDVFPILDTLVADEDLKALRMVAAKHHADALLIVGGAAQIDRYINGWGWTYALLLPTLFVPGSKADTLFMTNATLWDVRNEYLYLTAEAEATTNKTYVAAFSEKDKDLINEAKLASLSNLRGELKRMIAGSKL